MLPFKRVLGIGVVIERYRLPRLGTVARLALVSKMALVTLLIVILAVTSNARAWCLLVARILVAGRALHVYMLSQQRKFGFSMIEIGVFPTFLVVTIRAFKAQRALVNIVLAVTSETRCRRLSPFLGRLMALIASHLDVLAKQLKVGLGVVKAFLVEIDDLGTSTLVIGVTRTTHLWLHATVIARLTDQVLRDVLVAIGTTAVLRIAFKRHVAASTLALPFDVRVDQLTWGQNGLEPLRSRRQNH
jgi:hypothetical protein